MTQSTSYASSALICALAILCLHSVYHVAGEVQPSEALTFCAASSVDTTLRAFWSEAMSSCPKDPQKIMNLFGATMTKPSGDKCVELLRHQLRKSLITASATILEDAIVSETFANGNPELQRLLTRLVGLEGDILAAVWERTIGEVYYLVPMEKLFEALHRFGNLESKLTSILCAYRKYESSPKRNPAFISAITYYLTKYRRNALYPTLPNDLRAGADEIYQSFPPMLRLLYSQQPSGTFRLLNIGLWEYLYCSIVIDVMGDRRTPFTWIAEKNSTNHDSNLFLDVDSAGNVALAHYYGETLNYFYVDDDDSKLFFWFGAGDMLNRWWRVVWHEGDFLTFENVKSSLLLCAITERDEQRRSVSLSKKDYNVPECHWTVVPQ